MIIYTKYSNERSREFCIRTEIEQDENEKRLVWKRAAFPEAEQHIAGIAESFRQLKQDLAGSGLSVNECLTGQPKDAVCFPFIEGRTLEEELDELLGRKQTEALTEKIRSYFDCFSQAERPFRETEAFRRVFGSVSFAREQTARKVSDIDMIFSNAIADGSGYTLIDYEWTFDFPVPVRYLQYRCLYYYVLGNAKRNELIQRNLYELFDISESEQETFAGMERSFQSYMLGNYTPVWKLYDDISDGVIPVLPLVQKASAGQRSMRTVEVYFDDGRGFGTWLWKKYQTEAEGQARIRIELPAGTKRVRIDPCAARSVVRVLELQQGGTDLSYSAAGGVQAPNGDWIFDTEDPQLILDEIPNGTEAVEAAFLAEPIGGLTREVILNQSGQLAWMEQTKVWKAYRKLKRS